MKTPKQYFGALALFCTIALVIGTAGAAAVSGPGNNHSGNMTAHGGPASMLDHLEKQGIDVSAIRAAIGTGDMSIVHSLMQPFMEAHKDLMPARNATEKNGPGFGPGMMENRLARLEAQGYDVSAIRAAAESGDNSTARTLMLQLMEAHKDELPQPCADHTRNQSRSVSKNQG
jgi:hypothetical protein